ncbi:sugar kinase [Paenibacillus sp. FSL R7-0048]|jgi:2-dehydro-3-deoxygluconokinase|uniref:2-dehydro-3-deoxygluconokinase n=1 Tax=Paenibacillus odorifer TaxID=189426 RepID=A0A1R0X544_9BACL|nr:sugar kinase [Paenibacillus odorifer]OMD29247.1 2-dehydro-3-deoxygluconokinase [Paenibacillus odorifer]OMD56715.1 2-dehydro-3-deoxygluconokinase [Paenibacillus odorifer]OMD91474.1 2-dehydro-3-deoxygluconokinase [Paenibacillus odorifer]OME03332.1 2-dehydro-3-deoxygluconokinase [Paenibacillus odorifer]
MSKQLDAVTFGEPMAMFYANEAGPLHEVFSFSKALAGAESNVATGLSRLNHPTGYVTKLGEDNFGTFIAQAMKNENINTDNITFTKEYSTGMLIKSKVVTGDPKVEYFRKNSAASTLSLEDFDEAYFNSAGHLHVTSISAALSKSCHEFSIHAMEFMKSKGKTISLDPNLRPSLWPDTETMVSTINDLATRCDWFLPGLGEGKILTGLSTPEEIADYYLERGVSLVVIKLGPEGAYYKSSAGEGYVDGFKVEQVVDTVGAGDGFAVGVISAMLEKLPIAEAVKRGNAIGALAVMSPGDMDGLPTREELAKFMQQEV